MALPRFKTVHFNAAASVTQTLPEKAVAVLNVQVITGTTTPSLNSDANYAVVTGTPSTSQAQFTGTVAAPSDTLTFESALIVESALVVQYVPVGWI